MVRKLFTPQRRVTFLLFFLGVFIAGCATVPTPPPVTEQGFLKQLCRANGIQLEWDSLNQTVTLEKDKLTAKAMVGSRVVILDQETILLSAPLKRSENKILVPADFKSKVIDRFIRREAVTGGKFLTIVVDAGHGGKDPGATARTGLKEKNVVLDISKRLNRILEDKGVKVVMTRSRDEFITLQERTQIASRSKADLFVSIHANSNPNRSVRGMEVYCARELSHRDQREDQRQKNTRLLLNRMSMKKNVPALDNIIADMLYTHKQSESGLLSMSVARDAAGTIKIPNRGGKTAGFFVLRNTLIPAILIEVGYLTNTEEERFLSKGESRQRIAEAIALSILNYGNRL